MAKSKLTKAEKEREVAATLTEETPYTVLSILQKRYVEARLQGLPKAGAARVAGITPQHGTQMENSPKVRAAIQYLVQQGMPKAKDITKDEVMTGMMDAVQAASTATELVQAWRELGKLIGAYEPERKILEVHDYTKDELKTLSDKELAQLSGGKYADAIDGDFREVDRGGQIVEEAEVSAED